MTIANVALTNTFDEWRTITNQIIVVVNDALGNTARFQSNTSSLRISQNVSLGGIVFISANITSNISDGSTVNFAAANTVNTVHGLILNVDSRVNTTQTLLNTAFNAANAAFNAANAAVLSTDINLVFQTANTGFDKANSANVFAFNTDIKSAAAFDRANSANVLANGADIRSSSAFDKANAANVLANSADIRSSAAFDRANSANVLAFNTDVKTVAAFTVANAANSLAQTSNVRSVSAYDTANAAFAAANSAGSSAVVSLIFDTSNAAFNTANSALANSATGTQVFNGNLSIKSTFSVQGTVDTASANIRSQTLTDGATINWDASQGQIATVTLGGNRALANATNIKIGTYILHVVQDGTGNRTLSFGSQYKWPAGVAPSLTASANSRDVFMFVSDGSFMYGSFIPDVR